MLWYNLWVGLWLECTTKSFLKDGKSFKSCKKVYHHYSNLQGTFVSCSHISVMSSSKPLTYTSAFCVPVDTLSCRNTWNLLYVNIIVWAKMSTSLSQCLVVMFQKYQQTLAIILYRIEEDTITGSVQQFVVLEFMPNDHKFLEQNQHIIID